MILKEPFVILLVGPTLSGKSFLIRDNRRKGTYFAS